MDKVASAALGTALGKQSIEAVQAHLALLERLGMELKIMAGPYLSGAVAYTVYQVFFRNCGPCICCPGGMLPPVNMNNPCS